MNNIDPAAYTPLERFFVFQALLTEGLDAAAFDRVSVKLINHRFIKEEDSYDPARLKSELLQKLFLLLLQQELNREHERLQTDPAAAAASAATAAEKDATTGEGGSAAGTLKKKQSGPPILTKLSDSHAHLEVIPGLTHRLYLAYRDDMIARIHDDERRYYEVQDDIKRLEKAEKEMLAKEASQAGTSTPASHDGKPSAPPQSAANSAFSPPAQAMPTAPATTRGPTPKQSPLQPAKPPTPPSAIQPIAASTSQAQQAPPARTVPLMKSANPPGLGLQPPVGQTQPLPQALQPPGRQQRPSVTGRPEIGSRTKEAAASGPPSTTSAGILKWEKPYRPSPSGHASPTTDQSPPTATAQTAAAPAGQLSGQTSGLALQPRPSVGQSPLISPHSTGPAPAPSRSQSTTPVLAAEQPIQPQQPQHPTPRPIAAAAAATATPPVAASRLSTTRRRWPQSQFFHPTAQQPSSNSSPVPIVPQGDKPAPPTPAPPASRAARPALPEHIIRQAAGMPMARRLSPAGAPWTPGGDNPSALTRGFGTKWASHSTPSTPGPVVVEPESPAYEPVSPPPRAPSVALETPRVGRRTSAKRGVPPELSAPRPRGRPPRNPPASATPSVSMRSQSETSQADELSLDYSATSGTKIKKEVMTPRPQDDPGETTTDESSVQGRGPVATPGSVSSRLTKRKRPESPPGLPPLTSSSSSTSNQVLWTRGFTKVSSSALDQISSHRHANMFATSVRERDAPGYRQIVLQPQDITSIRSAIKQGNKAAMQAANSLYGGDPGTASVWLPASEDLMPPRGIVNSAQLERELVHIFCNAIMYNPDPDRGPGKAFLKKRSPDEEGEVVGYHLDENGVVKNTRSMFVEVEKLLGELRSAEKERGVPGVGAGNGSGSGSGSATVRHPSVAATAADDTAEDEDELAGEGDGSASNVVKRRRLGTRN